ncbi:MAG: LptE family protein [Bacteroidota bacterium]|nr:MAG: LptE family protein [Bacteroidota bacterium]
MLTILLGSCGVYSFTGAAIEGKTIQIEFIENNARIIAPALSPTLTEKLRQRIVSQTSLTQVNSDKADYNLSGQITSYEVTVASLAGTETSSKNRLSVTISIIFQNKLNEKQSFTQSLHDLKIFQQIKAYKALNLV